MDEVGSTAGADALVGRDHERAMVLAALDADAHAVLLTGDAGIGKTAIWEATVASRREAGHHVLLARTSAAEALLPWVGMTDLLRTVPPPLLRDLPEPQHRALQAVSLQTAGADALDERTVGTALLSTLHALAATAPVLLAVDDLPYLDTASAAAVAFALRRLDGRHRARLVATVRGQDLELPVLQALSSERVTVGPLTLGAVFELLQNRGIRLPRPLLLRVFDTSGGNPLYAVELARALDRREINPQVGSPLPVPAGLDGLVDARIRNLAPEVADLVAATAATWRLSADEVDEAAAEQAAAAGMVVVEGTGAQRVIRAAHPLWSAAAYASLSGPRRRALHERLAQGTDDPIERVRHAALCATSPSAALAEELDAGVIAAMAAGVPDIAVALAQLAVDHTVEPALRPARLDRLADAQFRAGDITGAPQTQLAAMATTAPGPARARRRVRLAEFTIEASGWGDAENELHKAVQEAEGDPQILAEALMTLSAVTDDIDLGATSAAQALTLLESQPQSDPALLAGALAQVASTRFRAGQGLDHDLFARAIEIERRHPSRRLSDRADTSYAALLMYADDLAGSERLLLDLRAEAEGIGDLSSVAYLLGHLAHIRLWQGRLAEGRAFADEQVAMAAHNEQARFGLGRAMGYQGQLEAAEVALTDLLTEPALNDWTAHRVHATLGFIALSRGDATAASAHLDQWYQALSAMHFGEPGYSRSHLDYLSALVGSGRIADAEVFLRELDAQATRSGRQSAAADVLTGTAMLAAQAGRLEDARTTIMRALAWYDTSPLRFDRARTLLIAGQIHRRAKAKSEARRLLAEAEAEFASFGADAWRILTAAELARVNVRAGAPTALTETERQVAELAASGLTNREVADRLFVAIKTVEANLARAYRKLGIRSRAELGARMGTTNP